MKRAISRTFGLSLALCLTGCGSSTNPTTVTTTTTLPPCTQTLLKQDSGSLPSKVLVNEAITAPSAGRLDLNVDWTFPSSPVGVYVVPGGTCSLDQFNARTCNFLVQSEPPGPKPRKLSVSITAGSYTVIIANFATVQESLAFQAVLSSSNCPAVSSSMTAMGTSDAPRQAIGVLSR
jgi:hypothetical protein